MNPRDVEGRPLRVPATLTINEPNTFQVKAEMVRGQLAVTITNGQVHKTILLSQELLVSNIVSRDYF